MGGASAAAAEQELSWEWSSHLTSLPRRYLLVLPAAGCLPVKAGRPGRGILNLPLAMKGGGGFHKALGSDSSSSSSLLSDLEQVSPSLPHAIPNSASTEPHHSGAALRCGARHCAERLSSCL